MKPDYEGVEPVPNHPTTPLASGAINQSGETIEIVLVQPSENPSVIMIRWPDPNHHPTGPLQRSSQHHHAATGWCVHDVGAYQSKQATVTAGAIRTARAITAPLVLRLWQHG